MTSDESVFVVLPVKGLVGAKRRLAVLLTAEERRALVLAMLQDVVDAVRGAGLVPNVLSPDLEVLTFATRAGSKALQQTPRARSLNSALAAVLATSPAATALVILPDTPLATAEDVEHLLSGADPQSGQLDAESRRKDALVVIAPDRRRAGTNGLALRPPAVMPPAFGPASLARHQRAAASSGIDARTFDVPGLALDIDGPDDVRDFLQVEKDTHARRLLTRWDVARRVEAIGGAQPSR